ncbi:hypothetical protein [Streptomyces sp. NPDC047841]|uniref:hypothetical protein n=1 Tax=Streptomyces sp. NPDC047841 TaxID=3154708 RepID=UPI0034529A9E
MRSHHRLRRLVVADGTVHRWTVRHKHADRDACREVLSLYRNGVPTRIVFRAGEVGSGRYVSDGYGYAGCVLDGRGNPLNLREPRVVRAVVDEVERPGLLPGRGEVDGRELFHRVVEAVDAVEGARAATAADVSRAAAATPAVRRGCPPGP